MQNLERLPDKYLVSGGIYSKKICVIRVFRKLEISIIYLMPFSRTKRHRHFNNAELNIGWGHFSFYKKKKKHSIQNNLNRPIYLISLTILD